MHDEKIDFLLLDPSRNAQRWEQMISSISARALAARPRLFSVGDQLSAWARPVLAIAAVVAIFFCASVFFSALRGPASTAEEDPALVLARWAASDELPETETILNVLGEYHDRD